VPSRNPLLLPILAALLVAALAATAFAVVLAGGQARGSASSPDPVPTATADARVVDPGRAPGNVCDGVSADPSPGDGRAFDPFYTKKRVVLGITIVGGPDVDAGAFEIAQETIERIFANNDLEKLLVEQGAYVIIAEAGQEVLDLPEFACLDGEPGADFFTHVCGVADHADYPVATVNELDLLGDSRGPCEGINILYHEVGHLVQGWAMPPADYYEVRLAYADAMNAGLYSGAYAATNYHEYFAEGTQVFFDAGDTRRRRDREWLASYDPELYQLLAGIYGEG
jgi:hypothetical protein